MEAINKSKQALIILFLVTVVGILGYMFIENYTFGEALWMTVITVTTVGFGMPRPLSAGGQAFTLLLIVTGAGSVAYAFSTVLGIVMEGQLKNVVGRKAMEKKIANLDKHIIVCGAGRVGSEVVQRLTKEKVPFVVIDQDHDAISDLQAKGILALHGNATEDDMLIKAGIHRATGIVTALSGDANNVFVTLTSKGLNPTINVVARAERYESEEKLRRAGADKVIAPSVIGGRRMAISILKPVSVDFVDTVIYTEKLEIEIEEIVLKPTGRLANKLLRDSKIKQATGAMVVAIQREERFITNPDSSEVLQPNDVLIVLGTRDQLRLLEEMANARADNA